MSTDNREKPTSQNNLFVLVIHGSSEAVGWGANRPAESGLNTSLSKIIQIKSKFNSILLWFKLTFIKINLSNQFIELERNYTLLKLKVIRI